MQDAKRIEFPGALSQVTSRGDRRQVIYEDEDDRRLLPEILGEVLRDLVEDGNWPFHAYCLMSNHDHLLIEMPDGSLSRGMRDEHGP